MSSKSSKFTKGKLIAVIGDEDTVTGFLLGGIGELDKERHPNFLCVNKDTPLQDIEKAFKSFVNRDDIAIILINQSVAELIRNAIEEHTDVVPAVLEIPSKDQPYDPSKDSILRRAKHGDWEHSRDGVSVLGSSPWVGHDVLNTSWVGLAGFEKSWIRFLNEVTTVYDFEEWYRLFGSGGVP